MHFISLDVDSGARLDDVVKKIEALGVFALVHTSFNHGKSGLQLKRDEVLRKLQIKTDPTIGQIQDFLRQHDKNRYEESFIQAVNIREAKKQVKDGVVIELDTPPLDKFRLFFPLVASVEIVDLAETHQGALDDWEDAVTGLAHSMLGIHFDTSCTDPSRLYFTPSHPRGDTHWKSIIVMGDPLDYAAIPRVKKASYTKNRDFNAFVQADDGDGPQKVEQIWLPSGADLNRWHSLTGKNRLMLADLLETHCPDKVRVAGGEKAGSIHTECPFEHEHTSEGGTGTMAINCLDNENGYWTWFCQHDACQGRHKTALLGEAINRGWFDEELLDNDDFLLPPEDDEPSEDEVEAKAESAANPEAPPKGPKTIEVLLDEIDFKGDGVEAAIRSLYKRLHRRDIDKVEQARVHKLLKDRSGLDLNTLKGFWRVLDQDKFDKDRDDNNRTAPIVTEADFDVMVEYAENRIKVANEADPFLFDMDGRIAVVKRDADDLASAQVRTMPQFKYNLNLNTNYRAKVTDKKSRRVAAPFDVVEHLYNSDYEQWLPRLRSVNTCPFFTASGKLVNRAGYDTESMTYLAPPANLNWGTVSDEPSDDEVAEAKWLIGSDVFGDFPLGGLERADIEAILNGDRDGDASLAAAFALILLPFMREMIPGATPAHVITKPVPGSGSGYLKDACSIIFSGQKTSSMTYTSDQNELRKTLTSVISEDQKTICFDNIPEALDSDVLANAITDRFQARLLGGNRTVDIEPRMVWILTANNIKMSPELVRRSVVLKLDSGLSDPEARTDFKHGDIIGYVRANRGKLVWACLTLIQHWIANGMMKWEGRGMANFRDWAECVGGVLTCAGIGGFLDNLDEFKEYAETGKDADVQQLMNVIAQDHTVGDIFRPGGTSESRKHPKGAVHSIKDILNRAGDDKKPLLLPGWGYSREDGQYNTSNRIGGPFGDLVRRPWRCVVVDGNDERTVEIAFNEGKDNNGKYWVMTRRDEIVTVSQDESEAA